MSTTYDVLVLCGGSVGCVLASRLSEDESRAGRPDHLLPPGPLRASPHLSVLALAERAGELL